MSVDSGNEALELPAPAKLNLFLQITGRRSDGYHLLQTLFQLLDYGDNLRFTARSDGAILLHDNLDGVPAEKNLIVRAAKLLQSDSKCRLGADIQCIKRLPHGGGLGGGSSNAATTLVGLNQLWQTHLPEDRLAAIGLQLGADVPVFVKGHSAWAEGVGENLVAANLPQAYYLVIDSGEIVPTAAIFGDKQLTRNSEAITLAAFLERGARNDCEPVTRRLFPGVAQTMDWLSRYTVPHLTGTGGCVFGVFSNLSDAQQVAAETPEHWHSFIARGVNQSPLHKALQLRQIEA